MRAFWRILDRTAPEVDSAAVTCRPDCPTDTRKLKNPHTMNRSLPPLPALRSFEAAARYQSFKLAADELFVTPSAIGHQVKHLEDHLGTRLFHRMNRKLQLTDAGAVYLARIRKVFDQIDEASRDVAELGSSERLTLAFPPSLLATWMIPRLTQFMERHPAIQLRFLDTLRHVDFANEQIDAAIWYGFQDWPDLHTDHLFEEHLLPVCSPQLLRGQHALRRLQDLQHHPLIHTERRLVKWGMVLRAAGCLDIDAGRGLRFLHSIQSLRAAAEGMGVALAERLGVADDVSAGRLVVPFELPVQIRPAPSYYFVCPRRGLTMPRVQAARQWLVEELVPKGAKV